MQRRSSGGRSERASRYLWRVRVREGGAWGGTRTQFRVCAMPRFVMSAIPFSEPINQTQLTPTTSMTTPHTPTSSPPSSPSSPSSPPPPPPSPSPSSSPSSPRPPRPFAFCQHRWKLQRQVEKNTALHQRCLERLAIARLDWRAIAIAPMPTPITRTRSAPARSGCPERPT